MTVEPSKDSDQNRQSAYATTRWSMVLSAATQESAADQNSLEALNQLCQTYWIPLYAYARRRTPNVDDAKDLTQSFFQKLLEKNYLAEANPDRGRFRSFLITAFKNFLANEWDKTRAVKRGGDIKTISLDFEKGDSTLSIEPSSSLTPDQCFERQWVMTLLRNSLDRLKDEYEQKGKLEYFNRLKDRIVGQTTDGNYAELASELDTTEAALKMTVHRMRDRYRNILRNEIAETVSETSEIDEEIQRLFHLFENG